ILGHQGIVREMAFTGRKVEAAEALRIGLVNQVYASREDLQAGVREMAALIAAKSPLSIRGTKEMLNYSRDHSVADGLNYIATWNSAMLMSSDLMTAMMASMSKQTPQFKD
ncbi:MAG TPA: enoyl-CoA hydratase-related protein, partial [Aquabacterium sp.]|nr:enoyl-CoA hydratase-related protein [Aquabacterium sp.]